MVHKSTMQCVCEVHNATIGVSIDLVSILLSSKSCFINKFCLRNPNLAEVVNSNLEKRVESTIFINF